MTFVDVRSTKPVRVLVVDDHEVVRKGICALVHSRPGWQVVADVSDGREAIAAAVTQTPDIAIVDYCLPGMTGSQLVRAIKAKCPLVQVLVFTMMESELIVSDVLMAGARGFLHKADDAQQLLMALDMLAQNRPYFSGQANEALLNSYLSQSKSTTPLCGLTLREYEIVQLLAEGNSNKEVAKQLFISSKTVETHRATIMSKLGLSNIAHLVRWAIRNNILDP